MSFEGEVWAAIVQDEKVTARMQEIRVAQLQQEVRTAARRGDWSKVDELILQAEHEAGNNAWLRDALKSIKRYAEARDEERTSKEAHYSTTTMMQRMTSVDECTDAYSIAKELLKASHLRRKPEQGKRMDRPE